MLVSKEVYLINAYVGKERITIGAIKTPDKSNEIKGIPPLLKSLQIEGCIITIDAMGTQKGIVNLIQLRKADYVLALKNNHKRFYRAVANLFDKALTLQYNAMVFKEEKTFQRGIAFKQWKAALNVDYLKKVIGL